ncbi:MAG: hypothetical protein HOP12_11480 [Candidatus Eisenbacteria bacterium]|uniref:Uncharacterized protein n=1 Tax=Eiseniibacteriota bacterium TaxID=2212470 RepID=A0A849SPG0_UNCEI|nr:hypothetical protein [Candidatus Eisenbacteria bacterium]
MKRLSNALALRAKRLRTAIAALVIGVALAAVIGCASTAPGTLAPPSMPAARAALLPEYRLFYDALDGYGDWPLVEPYGFVFRPRVDPVWWRPYYDGYWSPTDNYGWVWNSADPFGWATDHYGRWLYDDFKGWVWVPGLDWAPAWVEWTYGNDLIGWAPLPPGNTGAWSSRIPNGPYIYAPTSQLAHTDLKGRIRTAAEVGERADNMQVVVNDALRDGVTVPLGPPIERIERASGFPLQRARIEELSAGAAPIAELRRAAERVAQENRSLTGRDAQTPQRAAVLRPAALRDPPATGSVRPFEKRENPLRPGKRPAAPDSTRRPR